MPIDSVSATGASANWQQVRNDFQTLSQSLQSGNLTAAQKAYSSIQQDQQNGPQPPANTPAAQAFAQLGQALQSGDIAGAQQAFSAFQTDIKSAGGGKGHHGGAKGAGDGSSDSADSSDATKTVASTATTTNADGTITVTTTYTDGTTSADIEPNPQPVVSQSPLAANSQQMATLLSAQEQAA